MLFSLPYHLERRVLPWGSAIHPIPLSWHLAAWSSVKSFTLLSPVQKGEANSHASSPGKQRGWIHLAERRGSHWERGAGIGAERINLQRLGCRQSPV